MTPTTTTKPRRIARRPGAAAHLGLSPATLAAEVCRPRLGIPMIKAGRACLYDLDALDAWLDARRVAG